MNLLTKIFIVIAGAITISPFILYAVHTYKQILALKRWRKQLVKGMSVVVDDGINIYNAKIISVMPNWVRVMTEFGSTAGVPNKNIYPLNYILNEEGYNFKSSSNHA